MRLLWRGGHGKHLEICEAMSTEGEEGKRRGVIDENEGKRRGQKAW